jgi:hypothetical protein
MVFNGKVNSDFLKFSEYPDSNKPSLINFAATDFESLRESLIKYIKTVYPLEYQNFTESDLGVMLIELVAYMGAVMSLKADMLAHENYISTAKNRDNVKKLLELLGVKLKGPVSAAANASLTLDSTSVFNPVVISPSNRVITITSPEDGAQVSYTLYKTINGQLDSLNSNASIELYGSESDSQTSTVWTNLALLEGTLVSQTGTFSENNISKFINLTESPVIEKSVNVYLNSIDSSLSGSWTQVDNLFFVSGSGSNVFEVIYSDNFEATVLFGDGINGKAVPTNTPYLVTYRIGGGSRGNLANEVINFPITDQNSQPGTIQNTSVASGGRDAESVAEAKKYGPLIFKTQDRLVTAQDYATYANSFATATGATGKAKAVVRDAYSSANILDIYLLQVASNIQLQQASIQFKKDLLESIETKKMMTDEVVLVDGVIRTLDLVVTIRIDKYQQPNEEFIKAKVRDLILSFFNVANIDFGKPFIRAELVRDLLKAQEIRFATVDNLESDVYVDFNEIIQLNNFIINVVTI